MEGKGKITILLDVSDLQLDKQLRQIMADDWAYHWHIIDKEINRLDASSTDIALIDNDHLLPDLSDQTIKLFLGNHTQHTKQFFTQITDHAPVEIFTEIKRAYSHRQVIIQNRESLIPQLESSDSLAAIAQSLSARVAQLIRQSEMRIALVDQLPVGVLGIDDENAIVLANPKAIEFLSVEDIPIWGMPVENLLGLEVKQYIRSDNTDPLQINRYDEQITVFKSLFVLQGTHAGTILVLTKALPLEEDQSSG